LKDLYEHRGLCQLKDLCEHFNVHTNRSIEMVRSVGILTAWCLEVEQGTCQAAISGMDEIHKLNVN